MGVATRGKGERTMEEGGGKLDSRVGFREVGGRERQTWYGGLLGGLVGVVVQGEEGGNEPGELGSPEMVPGFGYPGERSILGREVLLGGRGERKWPYESVAHCL